MDSMEAHALPCRERALRTCVGHPRVTTRLQWGHTCYSGGPLQTRMHAACPSYPKHSLNRCPCTSTSSTTPGTRVLPLPHVPHAHTTSPWACNKYINGPGSLPKIKEFIHI